MTSLRQSDGSGGDAYPRVVELIRVMDRLRSPGGCPWDAEQTHDSLTQYLVEETYELLEAIEGHDRDALREELGDLLLQVVFHARIAQEDPADPWSVDDVAGGIVDKLVRRHPHVFGDETADSAAHVEANWQARKAAEKGRTSVTDGVPMAMPALTLAAKLHRRARHAGVDVPAFGDLPKSAAAAALDAIRVNGSAEQALRDRDSGGLDAEAVGELFFALAVEAESRGVDGEAALREAVRRYRSSIIAAGR